MLRRMGSRTLKILKRLSRGQDRSVAIFAMKRSGQHMLANWLLDDCKGKYLYLNDVVINRDPYLCTFGNIPHKSNSAIFERFPTTFGRILPKSLLVFNYEDPLLDQVYDVHQFIGHSRQKQNVLLLRDIFSLFASRLTGLGRFPKPARISHSVLDVWREHARLFTRPETALEPLIRVNYNQLITDIEYQTDIARQLDVSSGLPSKMTAEGGGSSFGDTTAELKPDKLTSRFTHCAGDPLYRAIFKGQHDLLDLNLELFGDSLRPYQPLLERLVD